MSRLPYLRRDQLTTEGQALWDLIAGIPGLELVTEEGGLAGPFNAAVHAPDSGKAVLKRRLTEIAILTVGARWQAELEWWGHTRWARDHGVPDPVIDAIG